MTLQYVVTSGSQHMQDMSYLAYNTPISSHGFKTLQKNPAEALGQSWELHGRNFDWNDSYHEFMNSNYLPLSLSFISRPSLDARSDIPPWFVFGPRMWFATDIEKCISLVLSDNLILKKSVAQGKDSDQMLLSEYTTLIKFTCLLHFILHIRVTRPSCRTEG